MADYKEAVQQQKQDGSTITKVYMYDDWLMVVRKDGMLYKAPLTARGSIRPFPVVVAGELPDSDKLPMGKLS